MLNCMNIYFNATSVNHVQLVTLLYRSEGVYRNNIDNMASSHSDEEWLRKNIEDRSIRFYSFDEFVDPIYIGGGGYGVVFKAKMKTLGRTVAYKILHSNNEDEMIENFV